VVLKAADHDNRIIPMEKKWIVAIYFQRRLFKVVSKWVSYIRAWNCKHDVSF